MSYNYTISEAAYNGLRRLAHTSLSQDNPLEEQPYLVEDGIRHHTILVPTKAEGISYMLNTYAWLPLTAWMDTRPSHIKRGHQDLLTYTDAVRLPWWLQPMPYDPLVDDPELAPTLEEQLSLLRKPRGLRLTDPSREYYSQLARLHKMETYSGKHGLGHYTAACLEAIGLSWLSLPQGYELPPNPNKIRPEFTRRPTHTYVSALSLTKKEIEERLHR
jgi:hypothetical protein